MANNPILTPLANLQNQTTAVNTINANNAAITTAFANTLALDGTQPNAMHANLDMNSFQILNLPSPTTGSSPVRVQDIPGVTIPVATIVNPAAWINVKSAPYNAVGNGIIDDTGAINAAIAAFNLQGNGVLYFPAGVYKTSAGLTPITAIGTIQGDGQTNLNTDIGVNAIPGTLINCTSSTAFLFTLGGQAQTIRDISLANTSGITPTAGAGILVTSALTNQKVDYQNISISGFYINIDSRTGACWVLNNGTINDPVLHGLSTQNINTPDAGDWCVSNCVFTNRFRSPTGAAIFQLSSGGGKIVNVKVNGNPFKYVNGLNISASATSIFMISNVSIENFSGSAALFNNVNLLCINGLEVGQYNNATNPSMSFNFCRGVTIGSCVGAQSGGGTPVFMNFNTTCQNVVLGSITTISGFSGGALTGLNSLALLNGLIPTTGFTDVATIRAVTSGQTIGARFVVNNTTQASPTNGQAVAALDAGGTNVQPVFFDGTIWRYG